ncbi:MAG: hypothetical protein KC656_24935, partial [Myxococcales bacterium]|nr:hypothetical protein [Myxococcales bacterium]
MWNRAGWWVGLAALFGCRGSFEVPAGVALSPSTVDFGEIDAAVDPSVRTISVTNPGPLAVRVESVEIQGGDGFVTV